MKRFRTVLLGTALLAGAALPALAQPAPPPGPPPAPPTAAPGPGPQGPMMRGPGPHGPAALFRRVDANGDGRVTAEEAWSFVQARFAEGDRNRDGALVLEEFLAIRLMPAPDGAPRPEPGPGRARMAAALFRAVDANRDGRMTPEELRPALEAQVRALDANGDNGVTLDELPLRHGPHHGHHHAGPPPGSPPAPPPR